MDINQSLFFIIAALFYLIVGVFVFFSIFTIYILLRYGKSRKFSLFLSIVYSVLFFAFLSSAFQVLQTLNSTINA